MKSIFIIIAIFAAAMTLGIWQNTKLHQLKQLNASLESHASHPSSVRPTRSTESALPPQSASLAEQDALFEEVVTAFLAFKEHDQNTSRAQLQDMRLTAAKFSAEYIGGLSQPLAEFRFEDSSVLIDSEFTLDEKLNLMRSLSQRGDLDDPAKWADWLLKIDPSTWANWIAAKGTKDRYSVTEILSNWARLDNLAAGKWLENLPDSPTKAEMTLEYVLSIAGNEPDRASTYLPLLPEGESKDEIVRRINGNRDLSSSGDETQASESIRANKEN